MSTRQIAIFRAFPEDIMAALAKLGDVVTVDPATAATPETVWSRVDAAYVSAFDPVGAELLNAAPRLRWISSIGAGLDHIDLDRCAARGITVSNAPDATVDPTADLIFALLIATARGICSGDAFVRAGHWSAGQTPAFGLDITGRTLGIIGMGRIGRAIARRAEVFGMTVIYHNRTPLSAADLSEVNAKWRPLDDLLAESDAVILQAPLSSKTYHMIGANQFKIMKPSAILVNGGRGGLVDEDALVEALERGEIARAALDVFEGEPQVNPRLLSCPNLVMTPHLGTATGPARYRMMLEAVANLRQMLGAE